MNNEPEILSQKSKIKTAFMDGIITKEEMELKINELGKDMNFENVKGENPSKEQKEDKI